MKKILLIYAHPSPMKSRANRAIVERLRGLPQVSIHDIYEHYPDFFINVAREKRLLLQHDMVVFQHPLCWFNMPPLLKQWFDDVLEKGFAYGENGDALRGKDFLLSVTSGGTTEIPIENFFHSYRATADLCGMKWRAPLVLESKGAPSQSEIVQHAENVRRTLLELSES